jgi:hypothetical protein
MNKITRRNFLRSSAIISAVSASHQSLALAAPALLSTSSETTISIADLNFPLCWEYTFCFPSIEDMWKKLCSFIHDQYTFSELEEALQANYWVKCKARGEKVGKKEDWCELIELNSKNSPDYILENQRLFPTSFIPFDYRENRFM